MSHLNQPGSKAKGTSIMSKGKLNNVEKYAIQSMLHQKKPLAEIQKELDRPNSRAVKNYVEIELDKLHETVAKVKTPLIDENRAKVSEDIYTETVHRLKGSGMSEEDSTHLLEATIDKLNYDPDNAQQLYTLCVQNSINLTNKLMVTKTAGGESGVAAMSSGASERSDEAAKEVRATAKSRTSKGNIWKPKQNKMRD